VIVLRRNWQTFGIEVTPQPCDEHEFVSGDLTVGGVFHQAGEARSYEMAESYRLGPGECIVVRTEQEFLVPDGFFGLLCSKGSLTARGLMVPNTKVDPLFGGPLDVTVYNAGSRAIDIVPGARFCAIVFFKLEGNTNSRRPRRPPDISGQKQSSLSRWWARWATAVVSVIGAALAAGLATYITIVTSR
jgi:deoxycytidine triphosphate deaminase